MRSRESVSVEESLGEDDSTVRFCPVPQAMSMSALSVVPIDCVQYGLQEIRGLLYLGSSPVDKGSFILADDMDGDDRRDQGSEDDCRGMGLKAEHAISFQIKYIIQKKICQAPKHLTPKTRGTTLVG